MNLLPFVTITLLLVGKFYVVSAIKIVALSNHGLSHYKTISLLGAELTRRGHTFTLIQFNFTNKWPGIQTHTVRTRVREDVNNGFKATMGSSVKVIRVAIQSMFLYFDIVEQLAYDLAADRDAMRHLQECNLIMGEAFLFYPNLFATKFHKPLIMIHSMFTRMLTESFRLPSSVTYVPGASSFVSVPIPTLVKIMHYVLGNVAFAMFERHIGKVFRKMEAHFNMTDTIPLDREAASLVITQYDPLFEYPLPLHSNMFSAGIWFIEPTMELSLKYTELISKHSNGFILVAFGTHFTLHSDPVDLEKKFIATLGKSSTYGFVVSSKTEHKSLPKNVFVDKFVPQNDLLAHPSIKLFMSHVGLQSMVEACYHGVPIMALPRACDQFDNAYRAEHHIGMGRMFSFHENEFASLSDAIPQMINDSAIRKNSKRCARIMQSKPIGYSRKRVADYIEEFIAWDYNASHLRPYVLDMPWYEYHMVDVWLSVAVVTLLPCLIFIFFNRN